MSTERETTLRDRTREFALQIIRMYSALPKNAVAQVIGRQMLRAGTSVGAHHREAARARSDAEFVSKIEGAQQELEETVYWLELAAAEHLAPAGRLEALLGEADELMAMLAASARTVKARRAR
ncbi:four helix bundle protein [candidate division WOR-3 bacterium]|uniref:Four helix bundle protein n=1 Tax=candidate division WOR-3 bacterium TaxID=2052148 RepID=A0A937XGS7_UNCW3|nr:four helix bundle protein [candidate division WOR-3 bacterium]